SGFQSVVAAFSPAAFDTQVVEVDVEFVMNDDQIFGTDVEKFQQGGDGFAREIHVGGGLGQNYVWTADTQPKFSDRSTDFVHVPSLRVAIGEFVDHHVANVVAGRGITVAGITQSHHQYWTGGGIEYSCYLSSQLRGLILGSQRLVRQRLGLRRKRLRR